MNIIRKIYIISILAITSLTAGYSQDCDSNLQRASELLSQKKYCEAKVYFQRYRSCNANADVSTEIAMCERFCKIQVFEGEEEEMVVEPVETTVSMEAAPEKKVVEPEKKLVEQQSKTNITEKKTVKTENKLDETVPGIDKNSKVRFGLSGGLLHPLEAEWGGKVSSWLGGGISGEFLITRNFGIGLGAGYYFYEEKREEDGISSKITNSIIPVVLTGRYYFLTQNFQPYAGVDAGLFNFSSKFTAEGESRSYSSSYIGVAPVAGFQIKLSNALSLDINAKCNFIFSEGNTTKILGINAGFVFAF